MAFGRGRTGLGSLLLDSCEGPPEEQAPEQFADCVVYGACDPALRTAAEAAVQDQFHLASAVAGRGPELPGAAGLKNVGVDHRCLDRSRLRPLVAVPLPEQADDPAPLLSLGDVL